MKKQDVIEFFDRCAPWWDDDMVRNEDILSTILTLGGIGPGMDVLDVACGTGVLFPDYLSRGVNSVTGIDISPEMAKIAAAKFPQVEVVCGDVEEVDFGRQFDAVMVYNAFPHFPDPQRLITTLAGLTKPGGRLTVAHGMSRAALTDHHKRAGKVSIDLLHEQELAGLFAPYFQVDVVISTDRMYQVSGVRRDTQAVKPVKAAPADDSLAELLALLGYTVRHNDAHAQELAELAAQLKDAGQLRAYREVMNALADFDMVNAKLAAVTKALQTEE